MGVWSWEGLCHPGLFFFCSLTRIKQICKATYSSQEVLPIASALQNNWPWAGPPKLSQNKHSFFINYLKNLLQMESWVIQSFRDASHNFTSSSRFTTVVYFMIQICFYSFSQHCLVFLIRNGKQWKYFQRFFLDFLKFERQAWFTYVMWQQIE